MSVERKILKRTLRRARRVRNGLNRASLDCPRVSVARSLRHIYAQVIDDAQGVTIFGMGSKALIQAQGDKKQVAHLLGQEIAKKALEKGVQRVVFDRGSFKYHGRVKSLAEGLREGGLIF